MAEKVNKTYRYSYEEKMKIVNEYYNVGGSTYSLARKYNIPRSSLFNWIRKIRNACAHNERIYGITRENGRVNAPFEYFLKKPKIYTQHRFQKLVDLIIYLRYFLNDHDYLKFISDIQQSFFKLQGLLNPNAFQKVRADTGIRNIAILDELAAIKKEINYNKFEKL